MKKIKNPLRLIYNLQDEYSSNNIIPESPLYIDVEPTNACNFTCNFCVRNQMKRKVGSMDLENFKYLAKSAKNANVQAIRFAGWGEPFLNKNIYEMVKEINCLDMISHITTNGTFINPDKVLRSGLKSIYFSMQGLNQEEYSKLRNTDKYFLLKKNICDLVNKRNERGLDYPFVQITTSITNESEKEQQNFRKEWEKIVDGLSISYTWLDRIEDKKSIEPWLKKNKKLPHFFQCNEVRAKLAIHWDGAVTPCCEDYDEVFNLGNALEKSLQEIWSSRTAQGIRFILSESGNQDMFTLCQKCELCHTFRGNLEK